MHIVCSYTLGYFSVYDDEYGLVHYDDDDNNDMSCMMFEGLLTSKRLATDN